MTKTLSFAVMHFTVAFVVAWLLTGDLLVGGLVAVAEPAINTVAYHFHEKIWRRIQRHLEQERKSSARKRSGRGRGDRIRAHGRAPRLSF